MTTMQTPDTTTRYPEAAILADEHVPAIHIWRDFAATARPAVPRAHRRRAVRPVDRPDRLAAEITEWDAREGGG